MNIVRIGMVGARHGATLHLENLGSMRGQRVEIVGICSQSRESAEACARRFSIPFVTTEFAALLERKDVDAAPLMRTEAARRGARRWITADPVDVENWANVAIAFEDETRGLVTVTDAGLGGLQPKIAVYMTNAVMHGNMAQNTAVQAYAPDPGIFGQEYFTEKIETKAGWTFPSPDDGWFRGYPQEMQDFVDAIATDREPLAGIDLAVDCIEVIYAAYLSAAEGRRVALHEPRATSREPRQDTP